MNLFGITLNPWALIGALVAAIAIFGAGYRTGHQVSAADWQREKLELAAEHAKALDTELKAREREQKFYRANSLKTSEKHYEELQTLRKERDDAIAARSRAGGLRIDRSACTSGAASSGKAASPGGRDEAGAGQGQLPERAAGDLQVEDTIALPEAIQTKLYALAARADDLAEQLRAAQDWIKRNGFYGPPGQE